MPTNLPNFLHHTSGNSYEMFVDNHLLETFTTCPRLFYYRHIQNLTVKGGKPFYMSYGTWFHDVMEQFYLHMEEGFSVEQLFVMAAKQWHESDMQRYQTTEQKRYDKMCGAYGTLIVGGRYETPVSALTMVKQYYDTYYALDRAQWSILSVESGFGHEKEVSLGSSLIDENYVAFYYTGRPDIVAMDRDNRIFPVDHKTTDAIRSGLEAKFKPHTETAGYIYAIQSILGKPVDRCVINVCGREIPAEPRDKSKEPSPRFKRIHPFYAPEELDEWRVNAREKCKSIANLVLSGAATWPMLETQCFQYNAPCEFHDVDRVPFSARETVLRADYVTKDPWVPYKKVKDAVAG